MLRKAGKIAYRLTLFLLLLIPALVPSFSVFAANPVVTTDLATDETATSVTLNGSLTDLGSYTTTGVYLSFDYATDDYYTTYTAYNKSTPEIAWLGSDGPTTFSTSLTGLANGTTYDFRAVVRFATTKAYGLNSAFTTSMVNPDTTPKIISLKAYKDLLETDDCLFVILADIPYAYPPDIPVNRSFIFSLMFGGTTELGYNTGYAMNDNGYKYNVYSLYFTAADAIIWGDTTHYSLQLTGSPDVFSGAVPTYDVSDSGDYAVMSDTWVSTTNYQTKLGKDILAIAKTLEQEWQIVLLDEQDTKTVLSANGEKLFRNAIPGIQVMAPGIFFFESITADTSSRVWGTSLGDTYKARLAGVDGIVGTADDNWIMTALVGAADAINIPFLLLIGAVCLGLCVFAVVQSSKRFNNTAPGWVASLLIVMCFGMLAMGLTLVAIIGLFLVIAAGWLMFMRKS
jgi:hypothetical protein